MYIHTYIHTSPIHVISPSHDGIYMDAYIYAYIFTYCAAYIRTYIRTYIHAYIYTYIHAHPDFLNRMNLYFIDHDDLRSGHHADAFVRDLCNVKWFQFAERPEAMPVYQLRNSPSLPPLVVVRTPLSDRQQAYASDSEEEEEEEVFSSS